VRIDIIYTNLLAGINWIRITRCVIVITFWHSLCLYAKCMTWSFSCSFYRCWCP